MGTVNEIYERQRKYCETAVSDLVDGQLFVESIRKLGYRDPARAADELVDNSIEAGASNVHLLFGFDSKDRQKPTALAFVDDGHGMIPEMVSAACRWGGTDRHGSRNLFGRFGFGLPSASVSQGRQFSVYSRIADGSFYGVTIDLDQIASGLHSKDGRVLTPSSEVAKLPQWVIEEVQKTQFPGGVAAVRTVVIWEKLDFKMWRGASDLERNILQRFGVTYRGFLRGTVIKVNGKKVEPIDPLFTTPGCRYYEPLPDGAEPLPGVVIPVKDDETGEPLGDIKVRYSYMHPEFLKFSKGRPSQDQEGAAARARASVRAENNGLILLRAGRQIDVVRALSGSWGNNSRYVGVEIDFPPSMDDLFGVTTSKQQVTLSKAIEDRLDQHGVKAAIGQMLKRYAGEAKELQGRLQAGVDGGPRASELVMTEIGPVLRRRGVSRGTAEEAERNREREIDRRTEASKANRKDVETEVDREIARLAYKVEIERMPEAPFYRVELRGSQTVIFLNAAHRFYRDVYVSVEGAEGNRMRASLELLLFALGESEVESNPEHQIWYQGERIDWSRKLEAALTTLDSKLEAVAPLDEVVVGVQEEGASTSDH